MFVTRNGIARKSISSDVLNVLLQRDWPGNVRELKNAVERLVILSHGTSIDISVLDTFGNASGADSGQLHVGGTFKNSKNELKPYSLKSSWKFINGMSPKLLKLWKSSAAISTPKMKRYGLIKKEKMNKQNKRHTM